MTNSTAPSARANWVVRFYTRARKVPSLIGRLPDGTRIPGGPYTTLQTIAAVGTVVVLHKSRHLWSFTGGITTLVLEVLVAAAVGFAAGRFETGIRNPVVIALSAISGLSQPASGTQGGRPIRPVATRRLSSRVLIHASNVQPESANPEHRADPPVARVVLPTESRLALSAPSSTGASRQVGARPRTGLEELLAGADHTTRGDAR